MEGPTATSARRSWAFVTVLYFLQGLPYQLVQTATTVYLAAVRVPVERIGHASSLLTLPWMLKPLWSPLVDLHGTKRAWVLATQAAVLVGLVVLAFAVGARDPFAATVAACALIALASATHDVAADGFYLLALDAPSQARFVGVRSACYRVAMIAAGGGVVALAGALETDLAGALETDLAGALETDVPGALASSTAAVGSRASAWRIAFGAAALCYALGWIVDAFVLPRPPSDRAARASAVRGERFLEAFRSYFRQPGIASILAFVLLYRFGESMLTKMAPSFLLRPAAEGGLGLSTARVGVLLGTVGVLALIAGGIAGGVVIAKRGLRRSLWPMAIAIHAPNLFYLWLAYARPGEIAAGVVIAVEQLGYGFGFSAYMVFLMQVSRRGAYPTTHYAISTGLMGLGALAAGYVSGDVVAALGFTGFFAVVCVATIPSIVPLFFVPLDDAVDADRARRGRAGAGAAQ